MDIRFHLDPDTGLPHLSGHGATGSPWVLNGLDVIDNTGVLPTAP